MIKFQFFCGKNKKSLAQTNFFLLFCTLIRCKAPQRRVFASSLHVGFEENNNEKIVSRTMYWTLELASKIEDAPWPATKDELLDYANRTGAPMEVIENLQELEEEDEVYDSIEDIWPDYPTKDDFFFDEEEY